MKRVFSQRRSRRSGSLSMMSRAARAAATEAGGGAAVNMRARARCLTYLRSEASVLPEALAALGLALDDVEGGEGGRDGGRRRRRREHESAGPVLDVLDDVRLAHHEAAHGRERLRERSHDEVDLVLEPEVLGRAAAVLAEDADAVRVVDHERHVQINGV